MGESDANLKARTPYFFFFFYDLPYIQDILTGVLKLNTHSEQSRRDYNRSSPGLIELQGIP